MDHHNLALILRGDRKNPSLQAAPTLDAYSRAGSLRASDSGPPAKQGRFGAIVDPDADVGEGADRPRTAAR